jgi:hypothetical protein
MSADNFIAVVPYSGRYVVVHGMASPADDDCLYIQERVQAALTNDPDSVRDTREQALVLAHDRMSEEMVVEYGVIEVTIPQDGCGECEACKQYVGRRVNAN